MENNEILVQKPSFAHRKNPQYFIWRTHKFSNNSKRIENGSNPLFPWMFFIQKRLSQTVALVCVCVFLTLSNVCIVVYTLERTTPYVWYWPTRTHPKFCKWKSVRATTCRPTYCHWQTLSLSRSRVSPTLTPTVYPMCSHTVSICSVFRTSRWV